MSDDKFDYRNDSFTTTRATVKELKAIMEQRVRDLEMDVMRQKYEIDSLERSLVKLDTEVTKSREAIRNNWAKVLWLGGGGLLSAIVTWLLKGGLNSVL